jgi:ribosomal protein S18 acetylase RimI-like enzyme
MREEEFDAFKLAVRASYAGDSERSGGLARELAEEKAEREVAELWSEGLRSPGQWAYVLEDPDTSAYVGYLWFAERDSNARAEKMLWIYGVEVDEPYRGRGFGRDAMVFVEAEARARGLSRVELNVFGGNAAARGLYRSLGYDEVAVWMGKDLR